MNKMEVMPVKKLVLSMSIPIVVSMMFSALYNIVDSIFVAKYSSEALAAVSLSYPVQTLMIAIACGTGVGFNTVLARCLGEKNYHIASNSVMHGLLLSLINWLIFIIFGIFFTEIFLNLFSDDPLIIKEGVSYLKICTIMSIGVFAQIAYERIVQATGNASYNMAIQAIGAVVNIILDPIMIFGLFGCPEMGVSGAAWATVIGQLTATLIGIILVEIKIKVIKIRISEFKFNWVLLKEILSIGLPAIMMQSIMSLMTVIINGILVSFGTIAINVFGIYFKLQQFVFMSVMGMTNALIPIVAYNFGAKLKSRIVESVRFAIEIAILIMFIGMTIFFIFPEQLLLMFNATTEMMEIGKGCLRIISLSFVFAGINIILCSALQALNNPKAALFITLFRQLVILLPLLYILSMKFGLNIGWLSFLITEVSCAIAAYIIYIRVKSDLIF